ncbi:hypothetical protein N7G274_006823 [Stereocaulon virgatum]|uniref:Uncharacterized protein n=1 Tax=Stereocaulon virgatum TaxID=373712 RepID=A0ABR4A5P0_9LECA
METNWEDSPEYMGYYQQEWEMAEIPDNCEEDEAGEETSDSGHDEGSEDFWSDLDSYTSDKSDDEQSESWQEWERSQDHKPEWGVEGDGWTVQEGAQTDIMNSSLEQYRNLLWYPFLYWLVDIIGASFFDFSQRELRDKLNSQEWKEKNLGHEYYGRVMVMKDWNDPDTIELKYWPLMLHRAKLRDEAYYYPPTAWDRGSWFSSTIVGTADKLRNAAVHRHDIEDSVFNNVMQIPLILKDAKRAAQVEMVYKVVKGEPGVDDQTISEVHKMLDLDRKPCTSILQVHSRILLLLERGCFNFNRAKNPEAIEHWKIAEDFELRFWSWKWGFGMPQVWNPESPAERLNLGGHPVKPVGLARAALYLAVELRNDVVHRNRLNEEMLCWYAQLAILLLLLFEERILAMEIEILVEVFLSKKSREEVLCRLFKYYDGREVPIGQLGEYKRRDAIVTLAESMNGLKSDDVTPKTFGIATSARSSSDSGSKLTHISTLEDAIISNSFPLGSATAATSPRLEVNVSAGMESSKNGGSLGYRDICDLAIEKYVDSDSMYEPLRFQPMAPETQPIELANGTPIEGTAM